MNVFKGDLCLHIDKNNNQKAADSGNKMESRKHFLKSKRNRATDHQFDERLTT